jgi:hypothetical protein
LEPQFTDVDLTGQGETAGDLFVVDSPLYNWNRASYGQISLQGVFGADEDRMAITGGTGAFSDASGQTQTTFDPAAGAFRLTVHLRGVRRHDVRRLLD